MDRVSEQEQRRRSYGGLAWRLGISGVLLGAVLLTTFRPASGAFEAEGIPVANLTGPDGMISGTVRVSGNRFLLYNGARVESMTESMEVKLERGGSMRLCPRSQLQILTADANAGMMLAFQAGGTEEAFPLKMGDQVITPDWRVELTSATRTGDVGLLQVAMNRHGDLCLQGNSQPGSYFRVTSLIGGDAFQYSGDDRSARFSEGKMETSTEGCGCDAELTTAANHSPVSDSVASPVERYAASLVSHASEAKGEVASAGAPASNMPPSAAENTTAVAESQEPTAKHKKRAEQHPQDLVGYVRSFVHHIFGR
ncbi:hypothetical protein [Silvibacterium dinghuense]|uniref:Uncharacterized protein n=1 Tax=Silvibacterium dinghuense TaxID=1560006 RepID=A0A4Q1SGU9_9BACT|nr:hypothetical protein [Silvibacterium dinghuense]RXS96771.1 hypothetical protein ESZ00_02130 [Silvibacterium dinghuense]GGG93492.1 hypothetical protein GCM10011586_05320 [Silvibacterium dinghuense]